MIDEPGKLRNRSFLSDGAVLSDPNIHGDQTRTSPRPTRSQLRPKPREFLLAFLLLAVSLVTTTAIGARFMQNFNNGLPAIANEGDLWPWPWLIAQPSRFLLGWPFSLALLGILLTHEFGHYFACRYHGIRASLPWVLPAPTLSGTAGAIIRLRSRIQNRQALMDVGAYGPLAGYLASLVVVAIGFLLSKVAPNDTTHQLIGFGKPLTLDLLHQLLAIVNPALEGPLPSFDRALRHPVLIAGWIGLFVTALNLIPAGQLDGGHILYAISPGMHKWSTRLLPLALLACGYYFWVGWLLWGLLLLIPAMRHPRVAVDQPLDNKRLLLSVACLIIFILTFAVEPFKNSSIQHYLR